MFKNYGFLSCGRLKYQKTYKIDKARTCGGSWTIWKIFLNKISTKNDYTTTFFGYLDVRGVGSVLPFTHTQENSVVKNCFSEDWDEVAHHHSENFRKFLLHIETFFRRRTWSYSSTKIWCRYFKNWNQICVSNCFKSGSSKRGLLRV